MENLVSNIFLGASGAGAYGLVLFVLLLCGLGIPLPEDIVLLTGGYLAFRHAVRLDLMIVIAFLGVLGGDSIAFLFGRQFGDTLAGKRPFRFIITAKKRAKVEHLFARYGEKIVVAARFMPGARAVTYFCAGAARMRFTRFIFFDGLAALFSVPLFVFLGFKFGDEIEWVASAIRHGQSIVIVMVVAVVVLILVRGKIRKKYDSLLPTGSGTFSKGSLTSLNNSVSSKEDKSTAIESPSDEINNSNSNRPERFPARPPTG